MTETMFYTNQINWALKKAKNLFVDAAAAAKKGDLETSELLLAKGTININNGQQILDLFEKKGLCEGGIDGNLAVVQARESIKATQSFQSVILELIDGHRWNQA